MTPAAPTALAAAPLDPAAFAPLGTVLELPAGAPTPERGDITFWHATGDLAGLGGQGVTAHPVAHRRDPLPTQIERHARSPGGFLALPGRRLFVLGAPGEADPEEVRASVIGPGQGVPLPAGTWHWAPSPPTDTAAFLRVLRGDVPQHDTETVNIPPCRPEAPPVPGP